MSSDEIQAWTSLEDMMTHELPQRKKLILIVGDSGIAPSRLAEYAYYITIFYGIMGEAWGLSASGIGAGMLVILAAYCTQSLGSQAKAVYRSIALPLGCALSYLVVQLALHNESLEVEYVRSFIPWILTLVIVQSLSLRRGFLHRFALAMFISGLAFLPYMQIKTGNDPVARVGLTQVGGSLGNPNALAEWFGFCYVYFIIVGNETKRIGVRVAAYLIAVGCLFIVGLTVSRGALLAVAIATVIAFRRLLKRGFLPLLMLVMLAGGMYALGLFDQATASYTARGMEETGRLLVWPLVIERFLHSPLIGVGASVGVFVPSASKDITPHNSFLFIALSSGAIPLALFVAYWIRAASGVRHPSTARSADAPYRLPLLAYAFLISLGNNLPFMASWMVVTLSTAMEASTPHRIRQIAVRRIERQVAVEPSEDRRESIPSIARYRS
jgi:O-antigen ligase